MSELILTMDSVSIVLGSLDLGGTEDGSWASRASEDRGLADDDVEMLEMEELEGGR